MTSPCAPVPDNRRIRAATLAGLLLLSGTLFFFRLGASGLFDADEPAYAQAAREMLATGDWITPHFNGRPRFDKPVLFYWLIALSYRLFGVTEFAVRFWSALAGVILVLVIARAAGRWIGPPADLLAGLAFATNLLTALLARAAVTDMLLTLFVTLAILAGVGALSDSSPAGRRRAAWGWAAMGLAVLVKGPVGLVIPAMALGGTLLILREWRVGLARLFPWQGPILFAAITLPWYALVLRANGWTFIEGFVIKHHLTRFTGVVSSHAGPLWFYLPVVLIGFFPWSGFLPRALWLAGGVARRREMQAPADRLLVACACWAAGVFVFFSLAGTKLPSYLFPAVPAMALLVGACGISNEKPTTGNRSTGNINGRLSVVRCQFSIGRGQPPRWVDRLAPWIIGLTGAVLALGFALVPRILDAVRPRAAGVLDGVDIPVGLVWLLAGLVALGTLGGLLAGGPWRPAILAGMMGLLILAAAGLVAPRVYAIVQEPLREFAGDARRILGGQGTLVAYGLNAPTIVFYANLPVVPIGAGPAGVDQVRRLLGAGRPVVVISRAIQASRLNRVPGLFLLKARGGYAIYSSFSRSERLFK